MIKAAALYIVVIISLILSVICSALIMSSYYYRVALVDKNIEDRLERNLYSAVNLILSEPEQFTDNNQIVDLFGNGIDSIAIESVNWGVFKRFSILSFSGKRNHSKSLLAGYPLKDKFKSAVYLADLNRPISVCGNTLLKGDCYLPKAGVQRAYIAGKSFTGDKLVNGKINQSETSIPVLEGKDKIKSLFQPSTSYRKMDFSDLDLDQSLVQSFKDSTLFIYSDFPIHLSAEIYGNVIISSGSEIHVSASSKLNEVLLIAPYIKIADKFEGSLQIFGSDSISIGKHTKLKYPSAICLFQIENPLGNSGILLDDFSECSGVVIALKQAESKYDCTVKLNPNSRVVGQVYSEGYADIQGEIEGNLTANKVIFKNAYSTYVNHFMDAKIDYSALSDYYAGSGLESGAGLKIVKWLE
jgi:cytoskeletal protein CcmA (bactofilin family)